ncbi:MAG: hypothetical protein ACRDP3_15010 [Streptomyces sp.]|uniref:hypothetical protein n=1 Tax=Streptomyces sp. TaxID=1931 RepID=UPI003D6B7F8B
MTPNGSDAAPIYDSLVDEHGDVLAQARQAAEEVQRTISQAPYINEPAHQHSQPAVPAAVPTEPSQASTWQPEYAYLAPQDEAPGAWSYEPHVKSG